MKQVRWFNANANRSASDTTRRTGSRGRAVVAALLIVVAGMSGCSKAKSKEAVVSSSNQNSSTQAVALPATTVPSAATTPQASEPVKPKKVVKKRPSTVTYNDTNYGISLQYPRKYTLKTGDKAKLNADGIEYPVNFVQPGGITVAAIELPGNSYLGTDFYSAFLSVNVNRSLTSEQCEQFAEPAATSSEVATISTQQSQSESQSQAIANDTAVLPMKVSIRGTDFSEVEDTIEKSDTKYFHTFQNGSCYEFALGLQTAEPIDGIDPVNRDEVFAKLEKILASVKIKSDGGSEVAATKITQPATEISH
ncbi:MAG TPA: hypothetical protein VF493_16285 [Terriglobales bacterium]